LQKNIGDKKPMKKRTCIMFIIVAICATTSFISYIHLQKKAYINNFQKLNEFIRNPINIWYFDSYFTSIGEYPNNIIDFISELINAGVPQEFIDYTFCDPFSCDSNYWHYLPLYNKRLGSVEGFILLSAGIDGKIDNVFRDTLYVDDNISLKLYSGSDRCYDIFKKWFGKKDLLIFQRNGRELLKEYGGFPSASTIRTLNRVLEYAKDVKERRVFTSFHLMYKGKVMLKDSSSIYFYHDDVWIRNQAYDTFDFRHLNVGDSVMLTGGLTGWENDSTINIKNCIPVDESKIVFDLNEE